MGDVALDVSDADPERAALQMGTALGGVSNAETQLGNFLRRGVRAVDPRVALMTFGGAASCYVAIDLGFTGPNSANATSCSSGALGEA